MHVDGRTAARLAIAAVCGAIAVALLWWWRGRDGADDRVTAADAQDGAPAGAAPTASPTDAAARPTAAPDAAVAGAPTARRVTLLTPDARRRMAEQIAAARARRAAAATTTTAPASASGAPTAGATTPQEMLDELLAAAPEIEAYAQECVEDHGPATGFRASLALSGDPDIGTLIDARSLAAPDGAALPAPFADCVRDRIQTMSLRPLATGTEFAVDLEFRFDDQ